MSEKSHRCPLCGARLTAEEILDGCVELSDARLGLLASQCPHCQGRFEARPIDGAVEIGYTFSTPRPRFDVALTLPCEGLEVRREEETGTLRAITPNREWSFVED